MAKALIWTLLLFITLLSLSYFHETKSGMPLASTCSAAISAACHPPRDDNEAHLFPVQWGNIPAAAFPPNDFMFQEQPPSLSDTAVEADPSRQVHHTPIAIPPDYCAFTTMVPLDRPDGLHTFEDESWITLRYIRRWDAWFSRVVMRKKPSLHDSTTEAGRQSPVQSSTSGDPTTSGDVKTYIVDPKDTSEPQFVASYQDIKEKSEHVGGGAARSSDEEPEHINGAGIEGQSDFSIIPERTARSVHEAVTHAR